LGADMRLPALPLLVVAALAPACSADGSRPAPSSNAARPTSLLARSLAASPGEVAFPPEDEDRHARPAMGAGPTEGRQAQGAPQVVMPSL